MNPLNPTIHGKLDNRTNLMLLLHQEFFHGSTSFTRPPLHRRYLRYGTMAPHQFHPYFVQVVPQCRSDSSPDYPLMQFSCSVPFDYYLCQLSMPINRIRLCSPERKPESQQLFRKNLPSYVITLPPTPFEFRIL